MRGTQEWKVHEENVLMLMMKLKEIKKYFIIKK